MSVRRFASRAGNLSYHEVRLKLSTLPVVVQRPEGVRVRFAPSPTGQLHIGGFRSALYNYLFAKSHPGGAFVLRIEDTDRTRIVPDAANRLEEMLAWAKIEPDESPTKGGNFGPYIQSQRLGLYRGAVDDLLANGKAYRCFCSSRRLEMLRKEAARARVTNRYDGRCRNLTEREINKLLDEGTKHTVRLRVDGAKFSTFNDMILGDVRQGALKNEGDPIILKSDGFPIYHLANVVDDHYMKITHVLRGMEWQVSTPKHLLLYDAFGWEPPLIGHLPLVMNADGTKLSKRQGDVHLEDYKNKGYYPEAVANFVTLSGGGFRDRDVLKDIKALSMQQLSERFDHRLMKTNSTRVDFERLDFLNNQIIRAKLEDPQLSKELLVEVKEYLSKRFIGSDFEITDDETLVKHLRWLSDRIHNFSELTSPNYVFLWTAPKTIPYSGSVPPQLLVVSLDAIHSLRDSFQAETLSGKLREVASEEGVKFADLMQYLRAVLSGLKQGPPVGEMIQHLGYEETVKRLEHAIVHKRTS